MEIHPEIFELSCTHTDQRHAAKTKLSEGLHNNVSCNVACRRRQPVGENPVRTKAVFIFVEQ